MRDTFILGRFDRNLADIKRWAIVRTIRDQSVAEHSYFVAMMTPRLLREYGYDDPEFILSATEYALMHDRDEVLSGDIATPIKKRIQSDVFGAIAEEFGLKVEADDAVKAAVKVLDLFEAALFLAEEVAMGNGRVVDILTVIKRKMAGACKAFEEKCPYEVGATDSTKLGLNSRLSHVISYVQHSKIDPLEPDVY